MEEKWKEENEVEVSEVRRKEEKGGDLRRLAAEIGN